ncbi:glycosyltransferase family 1 protein [Rhodovarius crocodyli]|uniref:Glycosyltransferase family 1 protein n=1 Tax=Rhodovarius crocodyli TaxID=1979269 RepID=A0A437M1M6_9PROT|nr:glycosyltransferase family 1 protein [Rhodovarius crocodyli]RVT91486.1 glycosyltransferase family 1 protein [Rhodovarius crocodyli]
MAVAFRGRPSGMDRIEIAHARRALGDPAATLVCRNLWGRYAALPRGMVAQVLAAGAEGRRPRRLIARHALRLALGAGRAEAVAAASRPGAVFSIVSHQGLEDMRAIESLTRHGAAFVPLIHDIIPITHPEYNRPVQPPRHAGRMLAVSRLAAGVAYVSAESRRQAESWMQAQGRVPPGAVAPPGIDLRTRASPDESGAYFLTICTLEPRKNHMLLLEVWRELHARLGTETPRLIFVGRQGWEVEPVRRFIEAHPHYVDWRGHMGEAELASLLAGARALLFPSFAEGFGLPVGEALASGVPVIASDLAVLREVGGDVPDYLDTLDGLGWLQAVEDYADPAHPRRLAQLDRLAGWRAPDWATHFARFDGLISALAAD